MHILADRKQVIVEY